MSFLDIDNRRAIVERRAVADRLASLRAGKKLEKAAAEVLCEALEAGRADRQSSAADRSCAHPVSPSSLSSARVTQ